MLKFKKIIPFLLILALFLPVLVVVAAQGGGGNPGATKIDNPIGAKSIQGFIKSLLDIVVDIGTPIAVFFIIYSGFLFVKARGKPEEINKAKETFFYTIIGTAILLGAFAISNIIQRTVEQVTGDSAKTESAIIAEIYDENPHI